MTRLLLYTLAAFLLATTTQLTAQATTIYTEAWRTFKQAEEHRAQRLFALAQGEYAEVVEMLRPVHEPDGELLRTQAELNYAKLAVQLGKPDGEKLILDFVRRYQPNPIANEALLEMANYYFNENKLEQAVEYYERIPISSLSRAEKAEVNFRLGYANFVQKEFAKAKRYFTTSKDVDGEFYYPTNYYLGMIYFFEGNYDGAIE
ncbi:MAG: tetratricopeptide repeat protein [Bacteroidota bacterium]